MEKKYDLIIIGAGIIGCSMAYYLADEFNKIAVLDKGEIAGEASGGNLGQLALLDRDEEELLQLSRESLEIYKELGQTPHFDFELRQEGGIALFNKENTLNKARHIIERQKKRGLKADLLTGEQINNVQPYLNSKSVKGVSYCPEEGTLNPLQTCLNFYKVAQNKGVEFFTNTEVISFEKRGSNIKSLITDNGEYRADLIIAATGAWTVELMSKLGYEIPIKFNKGAALVTQPVPRIIRGAVTFGEFLTGDFKDQRVNVEPGLAQTQRGNILLAQITTAIDNYNHHVEIEYVPQLMQKICRYFPVLKEMTVIRSWAAITPYTEDGLPVYGEMPEMDNLFIAAGFKGALSIAPAVAKKTNKILKGQERIDQTFSPARFN